MEESQEKSCFFKYESSGDTICFAGNGIWEEWNGVQIEGCTKKDASPWFLCPEDVESWQKFLKKKEGGAYSCRMKKKDGDFYWCSFHSSAITKKEGGYTLLGCVENIDNQVKEKEKEQFLSRLDPLTEVFNAENIRREADAYLKNQGGNGKHALLIVDIDDLKTINTSLGYLFGDTVLANLAEALKESVPEDTLIGRVGGDEFMLLLKNITGMEMVMDRVKRIRTAIEAVYAGENRGPKITCCMGVAQYPGHGQDCERLFENADKALYHARENGNNKVQLYNQTLLCCLPEKESSYYNQYRMHDSQWKLKGGEQEIIRFAFDILEKTKDANSAIKLLLEKIGKEYHGSSVRVMEAEKEDGPPEVVYEWYSRQESGRVQAQETFPDGQSFSSQGICTEEGEAVSRLFSAFYEEGRFRGCVCITYAGRRKWSQIEKETLIEITKIVSFYLLKLRVSEKIDERLEYMKNYDTMTGLPTLHKFRKDVQRLLKAGTGRYAVIYWDIANFKFINDTYGYQAGDRILHDLASFLKEKLSQEECMVARVSADKFVGFRPAEGQEELRQWVNEVGVEFHDLQREKNISVNMILISGVYLMEEENRDISTAIDNANVARKAGKGGIPNVCRFYDESMEEAIRREIEIVNNMEEALKNKEFIVYFQPKIDLVHEQPAGAEALVRWKRFDGSMMSPAEFIPLFERNGFILQLDFYVYEEVCRTLRWWLDNGMKVVPISVNVSRVHLNDQQFISKLKALVDYYQVPPQLLELELTESMFLNNTKATLNTMQELRQMGFRVSIDDFGAGYSSLSLLKDMASDVIKLDKEFFVHGNMLKEEKIVVSSIINMAKQLNMKVLSEGIETRNQTEFLKKIDCDLVQGYFYARPMPIRDFERFINCCDK